MPTTALTAGLTTAANADPDPTSKAILDIASAFSKILGQQHLVANQIVQQIQNPWGAQWTNIVNQVNGARNAGTLTAAMDQAAITTLDGIRNQAIAAIAQFGTQAAANQARATINSETDTAISNLTQELATRFNTTVTSGVVATLTNAVSGFTTTEVVVGVLIIALIVWAIRR